MEESEASWELDEIETLRGLVQLYRQNFERLSREDRSQYATHGELVYAFQKLLECTERSLTQMEQMSGYIRRLTDAMGRLVDNVERLTDEVIYLKEKIGDDGE